MNPAEVARYYGKNDELHLAFNFSFLYAPWSAEAFRRETERFQKHVGRRGWPDHVLSSHDAPRHASRYDHPTLGDARARLAALMLLTLRGTPFLYQGEEIGMRNVAGAAGSAPGSARLPAAPEAVARSVAHAAAVGAGPGRGLHQRRAVAAARHATPSCATWPRSASDAGSLLHLYRELLALRKRTPALHAARTRARRAPKDVFAFERTEGAQRAVVALNFGDAPATVSLGRGRVAEASTRASGRRAAGAARPSRARPLRRRRRGARLTPERFARNIPLLLAARFLFWTHFVSAILVPFFRDWGGLDLGQILLLNAWFMFWNCVLEVPTGAVADRFGRRVSLLLGLAVGALSTLVYVSAPRLGVFLLAEVVMAISYTLDLRRRRGAALRQPRRHLPLARGEARDRAARVREAARHRGWARSAAPRSPHALPLRGILALQAVPMARAALVALGLAEPPSAARASLAPVPASRRARRPRARARRARRCAGSSSTSSRSARSRSW